MVIPAYRCAETLADAVDSALNQAVPVEVLVINDCSPEDLDGVMARYRQEPRVRYLKNEVNMGAAGTRNRGVSEARGTYVAFLDADDCWAPEKLQKQLQKLRDTGASLCATARVLVRPDGCSTGRIIPVKERITARQLRYHNSINCSSVLLKTEIIRQFPMAHEDSHEDYITWMKILEAHGPACGVNEPLLRYRVSDTGKSGSKGKSAVMTWRAYGYMGFSLPKKCWYFVFYMLNGVWKHYLG